MTSSSKWSTAVAAALFLCACSSSGNGTPPLRTCDTSGDCRGGELCREGVCREACGAGELCEGERAVCDVDRGVCVSCLSDSDCEDGLCVASECVAGMCRANTDCRGGEVCDVAGGGVCVEVQCRESADCAGGEICRDFLCVSAPPPCSSDADCADSETCVSGVCEPRGCASDGDCAGGERCVAGSCEPIGCTTDTDCGGGEICDAGRCVSSGCTRDGDCGPTERCISGTCLPLTGTCETDDDCTGGDMCVDGECLPVACGCTSDAECGRDFTCVDCVCLIVPDCVGDGDCPSGQMCDAGECVADCSASAFTCEDLGADCGAPDDGCGTPLSCGTCGAGTTCGGNGTPFVCGSAGGLLISEYVEGVGSNKAIEIYNPTGGRFELARCVIERFNNGATTPTTQLRLDAAGESIGPGEVIVIADPEAASALIAEADALSNVVEFNGDDYLQLRCDGAIVDSFGVFGEDPGDEWIDGTVSTLDRTLVRFGCGPGDTAVDDAFDGSAWVGFPRDTFDRLGFHTCDCAPVTCEDASLCGSLPDDGCGVPLSCGGCPVGETCGGGGTANMCGAAPMFSEYIEGSGNNKALEIYNPGSGSASLAGCRVERYNDGATDVSFSLDLGPLGPLAARDVLVLANPDASATVLAVADHTGPITFFNGDDTLLLICDGAIVDSIGQLGVDPGVAWTDLSASTAEMTLIRDHCGPGDSNASDVFVPSAGWTAVPQDTFSDLGLHSCL